MDDNNTGVAEGHPSRGRSAAAVLCLVVAALLTIPAGVSYWGQRTLNDTQQYVDTVGPLAKSPELQDVIASTVTGAIEKQVDVRRLLDDVFARTGTEAARLDLLAGPLAAAIDAAVDREVRAVLASSTFDEIWVRVNTRVQQLVHRLLAGGGGGLVSLRGDDVVLDVGEIIDEVKSRLAARGLTFVQDVSVPREDREVVLMKAPRLEEVRTIYAFANPVARWMLPAVAVLFLAAFVLAGRRARMAVAIGIAVALNALLLALALSVGRQLFVDGLSDTSFGPASGSFYATLLAYLYRGQTVVLWLGITLIVAGWFAGRNRYGTAVREAVRDGLERAGSTVLGRQGHEAGSWVAANAAWLRVTAVVVAAVVLLWGGDVDLTRWWWSLALAVGLLAVVQFLIGAARPGARSAAPTASTDPLPAPSSR
ncbi:hypothetical protein H9L21_07715 [Aeromicrobium senzhongii]|uniref:Integral membrane protein n=1 Tax=Aeromicrobium senzhongii TaxID=2663859 RepID=A0ABX6SYE6_9ACTN|nr:hypothetical protein [Aeromicrobium senzhongii]MTB87149.1 hypothetical protein [Aeromicrobium senzhongii]QNL95770.1 hypothetical protein H9L21_07715 [Aeromicrobium senzhongii]